MKVIKFLFKILRLKDVKAEIKAHGWKGALVSRKFWGILWIIGGEALKSFFGVEIDTELQQSITDYVVTFISLSMEIFGVAMQLKSYGELIAKKLKEAEKKKNG